MVSLRVFAVLRLMNTKVVIREGDQYLDQLIAEVVAGPADSDPEAVRLVVKKVTGRDLPPQISGGSDAADPRGSHHGTSEEAPTSEPHSQISPGRRDGVVQRDGGPGSPVTPAASSGPTTGAASTGRPLSF